MTFLERYFNPGGESGLDPDKLLVSEKCGSEECLSSVLYLYFSLIDNLKGKNR